MQTKILKALKNFNDEDQLILQLYFYEHLSVEEISVVLEISENKVLSTYENFLHKVGLKK